MGENNFKELPEEPILKEIYLYENKMVSVKRLKCGKCANCLLLDGNICKMPNIKCNATYRKDKKTIIIREATIGQINKYLNKNIDKNIIKMSKNNNQTEERKRGSLLQLEDGRFCMVYDKQPIMIDKHKIVLYICDSEGNKLKNEQGQDRMLVKQILEYTREILPKATLIAYID
ncbi:hypothetical protein M0Q97_12575 [Candidatus Dojkabacteria bacterium]|jgi:hypothetical protein|nr:hypothetical protein [Candidatus Dojkabacteria bacterium]